MRKALVFGLFASLVAASCQQGKMCPTEEKVKASMKELIPQEFRVESVQALKEIPGLCEVVIKVGAQPIVFYTDKEMKYVLAGDLLSLAEKKNITRERQQEFMKLSQDLLKDLEKHTDFVFGKVGSQRYIYLWTDPDCPFCKRSEPIVEKWANEKGVEVRVILFPLPIHPQAFEKSVSLVCDKKGWEEYKAGITPTTSVRTERERLKATYSLQKSMV
jgi:thiol:disulfide interchange protein DsbC